MNSTFSAILNAFPFRALLWRFMPRRQPLPLTFINRAVNRYLANAWADRFESTLLFRWIDRIFVIVTGGEPSRYFGVLFPAASPCL